MLAALRAYKADAGGKLMWQDRGNPELLMRLPVACLMLFAPACPVMAADWEVQQGVQAFVDLPYIGAITTNAEGNAMIGLKCYQRSDKLSIGGFSETILMTGVENDQVKKGDEQMFALRSDTGKQTKATLEVGYQSMFYADGKKQADFVAATIEAMQGSTDHFGTLFEGSTFLFDPKNTAEVIGRMRAFCDMAAK